MRFRKKPVVIEATQWHKYEDVPDVLVYSYERSGVNPLDSAICGYCKADLHVKGSGVVFHTHGWIDTAEDGHIVCPGDWIITGVKGERYPCKPDIFDATYEPAE